MKMRILFSIVCLINLSMVAQQDVQFTNFNLYKSYYNPGALIESNDICGSLIARNQWSGLAGNPQSLLLNVGHKIVDHHFVGLNLISDDLGQQHSNLIKLGYAYKFEFSSKLMVGAGLNVSWFQSRWGNNYITPDTAPQDDLSIPDGGAQSSILDMDFGVYILRDNLSVGLSSSHLNEGEFTSNDASAINFGYNAKRHYYLVAGYKQLSNFGELRPTVFVKSDGASTQIDLQVKDWIRQNYMIGLNYRLGASIDPMIGYKQTFGSLSVSAQYSYGIITNQISQYSRGSHELGLHFCYRKPLLITKSGNPRFL